MPAAVNHIQRFEHGGATLVSEQLGPRASQHLVFLHGWGANRESLRGIATLFENTHAIHLIDLPGFGEAPVPPPDWDTSKYADLVARFLSSSVSGPFVLVGHSFGARVSVRLAARRLPNLRAVVLMAAPGLPAPFYSRARLRRSAIRLLRRALYAVRPITGLSSLTRPRGLRSHSQRMRVPCGTGSKVRVPAMSMVAMCVDEASRRGRS